MEYPWYDIIEGSKDLEQGDILPSWPFTLPKEISPTDGKMKAEIVEYDAIIMSQSCDISFRKINLALLCPIMDLESMGEKYKNPGEREKLRKGEIIGYHMLNKCDSTDLLEKCGMMEYSGKYLIVDFRNAISFPLELLISSVASKAKSRLRLLPPYREHLSQAFARFIMRVGLPNDIPNFSSPKEKCSLRGK
jgi:hypothetical protein